MTTTGDKSKFKSWQFTQQEMEYFIACKHTDYEEWKKERIESAIEFLESQGYKVIKN